MKKQTKQNVYLANLSRLLSWYFLEANFRVRRTKGDSVVYFPRQTIRLLVNLFATILLSIWRLNKHQTKHNEIKIFLNLHWQFDVFSWFLVCLFLHLQKRMSKRPEGCSFMSFINLAHATTEESQFKKLQFKKESQSKKDCCFNRFFST